MPHKVNVAPPYSPQRSPEPGLRGRLRSAVVGNTTARPSPFCYALSRPCLFFWRRGECEFHLQAKAHMHTLGLLAN